MRSCNQCLMEMGSRAQLKMNCKRWPTERMTNYINRLEEERGKIEAFKRELPLCMQLLNDVIEASREQLADSPQEEAVLPQFIPLPIQTNKGGLQRPICGEQTLPSNRQLFSDAKHRVRGAFQPFSKERQAITSKLGRSRTFPEPEIASSVAGNESKLGACNTKTTTAGQDKESVTGTASNTHRKSRRCWSPELHRRFVNSLQQLGGSQVATPKQIRELMKVEGLTNDEVKSHLQKYRLHTRRPSPPLLLVGGIWRFPSATQGRASSHSSMDDAQELERSHI